MLHATLNLVHLLCIVLWVGGMAFTLWCLRPALPVLEAPQRLKLMHAVLGRFFALVSWAALLALGTGVAMMVRAERSALQAGSPLGMPLEWLLMAVLGVAMVAIFGHIRFTLYKRLTRALQAPDPAAGAAALAAIRTWVTVNLALGLVIVVAVKLASAS
jgi:uncharacterized membrane protein